MKVAFKESNVAPNPPTDFLLGWFTWYPMFFLRHQRDHTREPGKVPLLPISPEQFSSRGLASAVPQRHPHHGQIGYCNLSAQPDWEIWGTDIHLADILSLPLQSWSCGTVMQAFILTTVSRAVLLRDFAKKIKIKNSIKLALLRAVSAAFCHHISASRHQMEKYSSPFPQL